MGHEVLGLATGLQYVYLDGNLKGKIQILISERFRADGNERIDAIRRQLFSHGYLVDDPRKGARRKAAQSRYDSCLQRLEALKTRFRNDEVQVVLPKGKEGLISLEVDDLGGKRRVVRLTKPASRWLLVETERHIHRRGNQVMFQWWLYSEEQRRIILLHEHEETLVAKRQDWSMPDEPGRTTSLRADFFAIIGELFGPEWPERFEKLFQYQDIREASYFPAVQKRCEEEIGPAYQLEQDRRRAEDEALEEKLEQKYGPEQDCGPVLDFQAGIRLIHATPPGAKGQNGSRAVDD